MLPVMSEDSSSALYVSWISRGRTPDLQRALALLLPVNSICMRFNLSPARHLRLSSSVEFQVFDSAVVEFQSVLQFVAVAGGDAVQ